MSCRNRDDLHLHVAVYYRHCYHGDASVWMWMMNKKQLGQEIQSIERALSIRNRFLKMGRIETKKQLSVAIQAKRALEHKKSQLALLASGSNGDQVANG